MATPVNDLLSDSYTARAITVERFSAGLKQSVLLSVRNMARTLKTDIMDVDPNGLSYSAYRAARLKRLFDQMQGTVNETAKEIQATVGGDLQDWAKLESKFVLDSINKAIGVELATTPISTDELRQIADDVDLNGSPLDVFWERFEQKTVNSIQDQIRHGMSLNESNADLVSRVTKIGDVAANDATAIVRTAVNAVSNAARMATYKANDDVVDSFMQRSVLDQRTSDTCMAYSNNSWLNDGKFTPVGDSLPFNGGPPRHVNCRSFLMPVVKAFDDLEDIKTGGRPSNDPEKYFRDQLEGKGFSDKEVDNIISRARSTMDGSLPADISYEDWLRTKTVQYQQNVLGPSKYRLWKAGKITFNDLVDQSGNPVTVKELLEEAGE